MLPVPMRVFAPPLIRRIQFKVYNSILRRNVLGSASDVAGKFCRKEDASTLSGSFDALQSIYANAQRLNVEVFERFDDNGDLCIDRRELNVVIQRLLKDNKLDDT
jgi:hypothetical protein